MITKNNMPVLVSIALVIVLIILRTCWINSRLDESFSQLDEGFASVNQRLNRRSGTIEEHRGDGFDSVNRRINDTNRRIHNTQEDVREIRRIMFELIKNLDSAD